MPNGKSLKRHRPSASLTECRRRCHAPRFHCAVSSVGGKLDFHRRRKGRPGKRRQIGAPHRRHRAKPCLLGMGAGPLANGGQLLRGEFLHELPRGLRRRGQVEWRLRRLRRRGGRRLRVEMPHVRMARRIRVRVAGMDGIHHLTRQVPGPPAGLGFSDGQLDNGRVANMVALLGANHERHHVAALDRCLEALSGLGVARDRLRAAGADVAVRQDAAGGCWCHAQSPIRCRCRHARRPSPRWP